MNMIDEIKKTIAKRLTVRVKDEKNLSKSITDPDQFKIGDKIEFKLSIWNDSSYELNNIEINIQQMKAVELENVPQQFSVSQLLPKSEIHLTTIRGVVVANPNCAAPTIRSTHYVSHTD